MEGLLLHKICKHGTPGAFLCYKGKAVEILTKNPLYFNHWENPYIVCKLSLMNPFDFTDEQKMIFDRRARE
jgi:hypothetical protein